MPSYKDELPAFEDLSAADEINKLIKEAIVVKSLLADSVTAVRRVDSAAGTQFSKGLESVDQKFLNLMNESRSSATTLNGVIEDLMVVVLPYSRMTQISIAKRVKKIRSMTKDVEATAKDKSGPYDARLAELKKEINSLVDNLNKTSGDIKKEADEFMKKIDSEITTLAAKIKAKPAVAENLGAKGLSLISDLVGDTLADVLAPARPTSKPAAKPASQPATKQAVAKPAATNPTGGKTAGFGLDAVLSFAGAFIPEPAASFIKIAKKVTSIGDFFSRSVEEDHTGEELDAKVGELADAKKELRDKVAEIEGAIEEASKVAKGFSDLNGRFGNFSAVWTKVLGDFNELGNYMESQDHDDQAIIQRINSEAEVYTGLKRALDDYAIRVTV